MDNHFQVTSEVRIAFQGERCRLPLRREIHEDLSIIERRNPANGLVLFSREDESAREGEPHRPAQMPFVRMV